MTTPTAPVKFPVICEEADIEPEILNAVLDVDRFVLVAKPDLSQLLTKDDRSIDGVHTAFTTPFTAILPDGIEPMRTFMAGAKIKEGISAKVFIVLDQQTSKVGKTCQVTTHDDDSDEDNYEFRVPIRCELTSALAAAQALEVSPDQCGHHTARALRNEAAITGGVWTQESAEIQHSYAEGPYIPGTATLPSILLGASPEECDVLTRHLFLPQDMSELNYNRFIVMDRLTEEARTVLLACNNELNQLHLLRSDFKNALLAILAPENTILTMNEQASEAASRGDGVARWH
ncbi:hypothetical protein SLS64_010008 [Diaporthe eres]